MSNAVMGLRLKQQLTLTPRLQQSVKLLQLSALECVQELHQAIAQNPFLEEAAENAETRSAAEDGSSEESSEDASRSELDFSGSGSSGSDDTPDWTEWTASPATLRDSLHEQLLLLGLSERDYALANLVVDALDEDGFLRQPLEEIQASAPSAQTGEIETALRIVQTLEPSGIAARDLGECLALQLYALDPDIPGRERALDIVLNRLGLMAARDNTRLLEALSCSPEELRVAMELIRSPGPAPGLEGRDLRAARHRSRRRREKGQEALGGDHQRCNLSPHSRKPTVRGLLPAGARRRDRLARAASAGSTLAGSQSRTTVPDDSARGGSGCRASTQLLRVR